MTPTTLPDLPRTYGDVDATHAIKLFVDGMSDSLNPQCCTTCIYGCLVSFLWPGIGEENHHVLRAKHHDFLDACMKFLTAPRTQEGFAELQNVTHTIGCDENDELRVKLHKVCQEWREKAGEPVGTCPLRDIGYIAMVVVHNVLQPAKDEDNLYHAIKRNKQAGIDGKPLPWPTRASDLLPFGVDASIETLISWIEVIQQPITIGVIGSIMELCKKQIIPPVIRSPKLSRCIIQLAEILLLTLEIDRSHAGSIIELKRIALFYHMIGSYADRYELLEFVHTTVDDIFVLCNELLNVFLGSKLVKLKYSPPDFAGPGVDGDREYVIVGFAKFSAILHQYLDLDDDDKIYHPQIIDYSRRRQKSVEKPLWVIFEGYIRAAHDHRCYAPGCPETSTSLGRPLSACARCQWAPYCSKQCQVAAWNHERVPHKAICKKMRTVADQSMLSGKTQITDFSSFEIMYTLRVKDETLFEDTRAYIEGLTMELSCAKECKEYDNNGDGPTVGDIALDSIPNAQE